MESSIAPIFLCIGLHFLIGELAAQRIEFFVEDFRVGDTPLKQSEEASPLQCTHRCLREANCNSLAYKLKGNAHNVVCALYSLVIINFLTESTSLLADNGWSLYAKVRPGSIVTLFGKSTISFIFLPSSFICISADQFECKISANST
eukprot:Seg2613.1 transcript_id=Seg2613.1/GoldUCD/mRNA.D3Y31 product="hypothetical protein" protein_id=Seg2613.1/GoldUCD/D3Y31